MSWIKLLIHPEHEKVLRIADLTGTLPDAAFVGCVRWFRWVDAHVENAATGISVLSFRVVTRWADDGLSRAMLHADVEWLEKGSDGLLRPTRPSTHFGQSAKQRGLTAKRVEKHRSNARCNAVSNGHVTPDRVLDPDPEKRKTNTPPTRVTDVAVVHAVASLKVSALVRGRVAGLDGLTVKEIADTFAAVKRDAADPETRPPIRDVDACVAARLLDARGKSLPTRKVGSMPAALSVAANGNADVSGLMNIVRNRSKS